MAPVTFWDCGADAGATPDEVSGGDNQIHHVVPSHSLDCTVVHDNDNVRICNLLCILLYAV